MQILFIFDFSWVDWRGFIVIFIGWNKIIVLNSGFCWYDVIEYNRNIDIIVANVGAKHTSVNMCFYSRENSFFFFKKLRREKHQLCRLFKFFHTLRWIDHLPSNLLKFIMPRWHNRKAETKTANIAPRKLRKCKFTFLFCGAWIGLEFLIW